jgi:signal transduction histidine kinase
MASLPPSHFYRVLSERFKQIASDPDTSVALSLEEFPEGSEERRLLVELGEMLERIRRHWQQMEEQQQQAYQLLELRVQERTRELSTLLEISRDVAATLELKPLLDLILEQLNIVIDYTTASISIIQEQKFIVLGNRGPFTRQQLEHLRFMWEHLRFTEERVPVIEYLQKTKRPVVVPDTRGKTPLAHALQQAAGDYAEVLFAHVRSWIGIPLIAQNRVIGMLSLGHHLPNYYTDAQIELVQTVANQAAVALENARLYRQAQELAALEERQRLARELHDSVSQALYGIALGTRTALKLVDVDPDRVTEPLQYVLSLAEAGLTEMRALIFELRPESLQTEGLVSALRKQLESLHIRHRLEVEAELTESEPELSIEAKQALHRIAQEALHNVIKHAHASKVSLQLALDAQFLTLTISDNGVGFDPSVDSAPGHFGLASMRERVIPLGGTFSIESTPGLGTRIRASIPRIAE